MKTRILTLATIFLCLGLCAHAQEATVLSLDDCRQLALQNNSSMKNANLDIAAAKAKKGELFLNYFPTVTLNGFAFHSFDYKVKMNVSDIFKGSEAGRDFAMIFEEIAPELGLGSTYELIKYGQHYGAIAIQPIFLGGRLVTGNRYASLGIEAAKVKGEVIQRDILEEVDKAFFDITALQEKGATLDALSQMLDSLDKVATLAYGEGIIVKSDWLLLQTKKTELKNGKTKLRTGLRLQKMNLLNLIGMDYNVLELDNYSFPAASAANLPAPEQVYEDENKKAASREETKLLDMQVKAKQYEKRLALGEALPSVGLGVNYGYNRFLETNNGRFNGTVFVAVQIPVTDWGKKVYKMRQKQAEIDKALNDKEHLSEMLVLQQRKFYFELTSAWDALELARSEKEYNEYIYSQARLNYDAGYTTMTDLLQAYTVLAQANEDYANAVSEYVRALQVYKGNK